MAVPRCFTGVIGHISLDQEPSFAAKSQLIRPSGRRMHTALIVLVVVMTGPDFCRASQAARRRWLPTSGGGRFTLAPCLALTALPVKPSSVKFTQLCHRNACSKRATKRGGGTLGDGLPHVREALKLPVSHQSPATSHKSKVARQSMRHTASGIDKLWVVIDSS
jgi:hypothetical protein